MYRTIQYNSLSISTGCKQAIFITGLKWLFILQFYKLLSNEFYIQCSGHTVHLFLPSPKCFLKLKEIHNLVHTGTSLQPPAPILHILSKAVKRCFITLWLKDILSLPRSLFSGPWQLPPEGVSSQEVQNRIHTAIEAGQTPRHLIGGIDAVIKLTHVRGLEVQPGPHVEVLHHMERQVGDGKDCKHYDN